MPKEQTSPDSPVRIPQTTSTFVPTFSSSFGNSSSDLFNATVGHPVSQALTYAPTSSPFDDSQLNSELLQEPSGSQISLGVENTVACIPHTEKVVHSPGNQLRVLIKIYEDELASNNLLDKSELSGILLAPNDVLRITFNIDANCIRSVSAKTTGKADCITTTNDRGRPSKEGIECIVHEPEKCKAEDEAVASRLSAKNVLNAYAHKLHNTLSDDMLTDNFDPAEKCILESAVKETISWLDGSYDASKEEYESKQQELEGLATPIMQRLYGSAGSALGNFPGAGVLVSLMQMARTMSRPFLHNLIGAS